jgi:sugar phosphate isomerase/epimerase
MKVGVFTVLLADRPLEDVLDYAKEVGCEAVEIGTGGYPGDAHCKPRELLGDPEARDKFRQAVDSRGWRSAPSPAAATRSTPTRAWPENMTNGSVTP